jgi:Zn-dependent protease
MASFICRIFVPLVWLTGVFALLGIGLAASRTTEFLRLANGHIVMAPALFYSIAVLCYAGSILWHELSHAVTAIHYGLLPSRVSVVGYLVIIPLFVIRIPGIYLIPPQQRIRVWAAGMWGSLGLAGIAAIAVRFAPVSLPWQQVLARIAFANGLVAVANLVPFMVTDGYFILSTVCRQANIRRRAWVALKELVRSRRSPSALLLTYLTLSGIVTGGLIILNIRRIYWLQHSSTTGFVAILLLIFFALARVLLKVRASRRHSLGRE